MFGVSWRFHSSLSGGASIQKTDASNQKKRRSDLVGPPPSWPSLEIEPQPKLHAPWIVSAVELQKAGIVEAIIDRVELCVVKQIEQLPLEVETGPLVDGEPLGNSEVKVDTPRQGKRVAPHIAKRESGRHRKSARVVIEHPKRSGIRRRFLGGRDCGWIAHLVRPRARALTI